MKYWNIKSNNNINSFKDLLFLKDKISKKNYKLIYKMIEWSLLDYAEKLQLFKSFPICNLFFSTKKFDNQEKDEIKFFVTNYPYIIDWVLQNWNQVLNDLNIVYSNRELVKILSNIAKCVNYKFQFSINQIISNNDTDQWGIERLTDAELFNFIEEVKTNKTYDSITYLFDKNSTLESIAATKNPKVTRERIRQIILKEIKQNNIFFKWVCNFCKKDVSLIEKLNESAIRVIEKTIYPGISSEESILNLDSKFQNNVISKFKKNPELLLELNSIVSGELETLIKNNCVVKYKNNYSMTDEKYWGKNVLNFGKMLDIFLKMRYENNQILSTDELQNEFYEFLEENEKLNVNYDIQDSRAFKGLIERNKELLYYDRTKLVVLLDKDENHSKIANTILNEFIKLKSEGIIMVSTRRFFELFNILTNYKFLYANPDFIHSFLKKKSTIENKQKYFSRTPVLINTNKSIVINIFYQQVQILFNNSKIVNWELFLDVLKNECGFEKILVQNYVSDGHKYFIKKGNNVILL